MIEIERESDRGEECSQVGIYIKVGHELFHFAGLQKGEHSLCHVECVPPIVVLDRSVILLDTENPAAKYLFSDSFNLLPSCKCLPS